jgi:hypothetical protein
MCPAATNAARVDLIGAYYVISLNPVQYVAGPPQAAWCNVVQREFRETGNSSRKVVPVESDLRSAIDPP